MTDMFPRIEEDECTDGFCPIPGAKESRMRALAIDPVHHPDHYTRGEIECIDAIAASMTTDEFAAYCKGAAMKYLWRAGIKHPNCKVEDLKKGRWYLDKMIATLE